MNELTINISWEYFLGIITGILALMISAFYGILTIAWKGSARFTALETSMQWVKDTLKELKTSSDNESAGAFSSHSPINLNEKGEIWLAESGLKVYLDSHKSELMPLCEAQKSTNPYDVQQCIFRYFDSFEFEPEIEKKLKEFAFTKGTTMNIMRRVAAIYFRNLCLNEFGMKTEDIDLHDPKKPSQ